MELGQSSSAKLEPFLLMSKSAKGAAAAKLIQDVTTAPGLFVFAELLDLPSIQDVRALVTISRYDNNEDIKNSLASKPSATCVASIIAPTVLLQDVPRLHPLSHILLRTILQSYQDLLRTKKPRTRYLR